MVCDLESTTLYCQETRVLILILLEYGLRLPAVAEVGDCWVVLILILLEYGLRHNSFFLLVLFFLVLILILLEYGLRQSDIGIFDRWLGCLNPYSIGIWSATYYKGNVATRHRRSLNPYSIGIWSATGM